MQEAHDVPDRVELEKDGAAVPESDDLFDYMLHEVQEAVREIGGETDVYQWETRV